MKKSTNGVTKNLIIEIKDRTGISLVALEPNKKYIMITTWANSQILRDLSPDIWKNIAPMMASPAIFIVNDLNEVSFAEADYFLEYIKKVSEKGKDAEKATENKSHKEV